MSSSSLEGPAALSSRRVPRSRLDALYQPGHLLPALKIATGVVASIDSEETCTVLMADDEVPGVVFLGRPPDIDELVEVEVRGDLLVIRTPAETNSFVQGQTVEAAHIVSSDTPANPDPIEIAIGASMRDLSAWYFVPPDSTIWTASLDPAGVGIRCTQSGSGPGTLWSDTTFPVDVDDTLTVQFGLLQNGGTPATAQVCFCFDAADDGDALPGGDVQTLLFDVPLTVTGGPLQMTVTVDIPDAITTPTTGATLPRLARLGLLLTGDGTADLTLTAAELIRNPGAWPLGSVWFDPDADSGAVVTGRAPAQNSTSTLLPYTGSFQPVPGTKKVVVSAPPGSGGLLIIFWFGTLLNGPTSGNPPAIDFQLRTDTGASQTQARAAQMNASQTPIFLSGQFTFDPGETREIWASYAYGGSDPGSGSLYNIRYTSLQTIFLPGAIRAGKAVSDPMIRYWDGDTWTPETLQAAAIDVTQDATVPPPSKTSTTTTSSRSPGSGVTAGDKITLTANVTPTAAPGSVTFSKGPSSTGPWTVLGTASLSSGRASRNWTSQKGTWYFQATYQGNASYRSSSGVSAALTVKADQPQAVTKTKTVGAAWCQAYTGTGSQISGSGNDAAAHQGYFSSTHGNRKTLLGFTPALPADAVVTSVELICSNWAHWYAYSGGTLIAGWHQSATAPATYPAGSTTHEDQSRHGVDTGSWTVNLTGWAKDAITRSTFQGIVLGPGPSQSSQYYGYSGSPGQSVFKLRITYKTYS